uniref:Uncharacterized protein n=1 Tax=Oryza brachyantha TaxID=4533 RepID=J3KWK0_ORYBR
MGAELLAVRGASFNPLFPYHEIDQLGEDEYLAEMDAGAKLHGAVEAAQEACTCFDSICGHLHAMILLLDYPGLLDVIEEERVAAAADLSAAIERVRLGRSMAAGARQDVSAGGTD